VKLRVRIPWIIFCHYWPRYLNNLELGLKLSPENAKELTHQPVMTKNLKAFQSYAQAYSLKQAEKPDEALQECQQALAIDPKFEDALYLIIQLYETGNRWDEIDKFYQQYETMLNARGESFPPAPAIRKDYQHLRQYG